MAYSVDFVEALDAAVFFACEDVKDSLDSAIVVGDIEFDNLLFAAWLFKLDKCARKTDFLNATFSQNVVGFDFNKLVFYGTTSAIEH